MTDDESSDATARAFHAARAGSFGGEADAYDEHRPDYPVDALRWGLEPVTGAADHVLDLGAGTGKLTGNLLDLGLRVSAVEPDPAMLARLRHGHPGAAAFEATAEDIPLGDATVDAVFIGQALHWFDPEVALPEIARVLRQGGMIVALWNYDDPDCAWLSELNRITRPGMSQNGFADDALPEHAALTPFEQRTFSHVQRRTADSLVRTVATQSHLLVAEPEVRDSLLRDAREFLAARPETADGEFDRPMLTTAIRAVRR